MSFTYRKTCCDECPWRKDVPTGGFPAQRFRDMTTTSADMALSVFTCHKSYAEVPALCAGFLSQGAEHNLSVRLWVAKGLIDPALVNNGGLDLFESYRAMAIANGVSPRAACLKRCRDS